MAIRIRQSPSVSEQNQARAREYFDGAVEDLLKLVGERTVDVGSIASGGKATFTVAVNGVRKDKQQTVQVALPSTVNTDLLPWGFVSNDNEVTVVLHNPTGGAIDPPSATYGVRVMP